MLFRILRPFVKFLLRFIVKNIEYRGFENLPESGPVVVAATHFNSFFDAIILYTSMKRVGYSLARGDIFKNPTTAKILNSFLLLPIHRQSEGLENMTKNLKTMENVVQKLAENQLILIYPEGLCTHQKTLLPLKKGVARFVHMAVEKNIPVQILPVAITYNSYSSIRKTVIVHAAPTIDALDFSKDKPQPAFVNDLTDLLKEKLTALTAYDFQPISPIKSFIFEIFFILHYPALELSRAITALKFKNTVFEDSVRVAAMMIIFPLYWVALFCVIRSFF